MGDAVLIGLHRHAAFLLQSIEHHDLKSLPKGKINAQVQKAALYKQWSDKTEVEKVKIAELATQSYKLCEREEQAVNARYILQKNKTLPQGAGRPRPFLLQCMLRFVHVPRRQMGV